jgi:hypothetical protein
VAIPAHTTATAMHFLAKKKTAGLIFLTDKLTNDRYLVDTGATLSIVPCTANSSPSGPLLKGTVPPDFSPLVFFFKQLLLAPVDKPSFDFDFCRIFAEIFDFSGASPVSLTPAKKTILLKLDDSFEL